MSVRELIGNLDRAGRTLARGEARRAAGAGLAGWLGFLAVAALADLAFKFARLGRVAAWAVLATGAAATLVAAWRIARRPRTTLGTAARIERAFPELDNHLINHLQFAAAPDHDPFRAAYVRDNAPGWERVDLRRMRNRRADRQVALAVLAGLILAVLPGAFAGAAWGLAVWRVVNPFSGCQPATLTRIVAVAPGNTSVPVGQPLDIRCTVDGRIDHRVRLDLKPADDRAVTLDLGRIAAAGAQDFGYRVTAVAASLRYRLHAGDALPTEWFTVEARSPLALARAELTVQPPPYTGLPKRTFNALSEPIVVPAGATLDLLIEGNRPLSVATVAAPGNLGPVPLARLEGGRVCRGSFSVAADGALRLALADAHGDKLAAEIPCRYVPDGPPAIRILTPEGRAALPPGAAPAIGFEIADDYGLGEVVLERVRPDRPDAEPVVVARWPADRQRNFAGTWTGAGETPGGAPLAYRIAAADLAAPSGHVSRSAVILFDAAAVAEAGTPAAADTGTALGLARVVELQRQNISATQDAIARLAESRAAAWQQNADRQRTVRELTGQILQRPGAPLGGMTPVVRSLYQAEMIEAVAALTRVLSTDGAARPAAAQRGLALEEQILRQLTYASSVATKSAAQQRIVDLLALLDGLVKDQSAVLDTSQASVSNRTAVGRALVDRQDGLATRTGDFAVTCRREQPTLQETDKAFADLIAATATACEQRQIKADMLRAAEQLETAAAPALPFQARALGNLRDLQNALNRWRVANAAEEKKDIVAALANAQERLKKLRNLEAKLADAMKQIKPTEDKSGKQTDMLEEELKEVRENIKDALLQVAKDLQIFKELTVANELVEDVYTVFDEVKQAEGSEDMGAKDAEEAGVLKPDELIEAMKKAEERLDDMEAWLEDKPEKTKWNQEAFDQEEMPKMALGALPTEIEDIIGELVKEKDELDKKTDDSATNVGLPDVNMGWGIMEGPQSSFAAKGKSGNQRPDHKEQDGRSIVGRQGMSDGETAAGGGTINEGDKNIEKRMTQDPTQSGQVQTDGEADEKATGGGKQASGSADGLGMAGTGKRMDATEAGSMKGLEALMARTAALQVKASLLNVRTESLAAAAHHMVQADDAVAKGLPIAQVREHERRALAALRQARTELGAEAGAGLDAEGAPARLDALEDTASDQAPQAYRELVADYFKSLGGTP